jgi:hypothetical protein
VCGEVAGPWRKGDRELNNVLPVYLSLLARAYGELGQFDQAWSHIGEAMTAVEITKQK